MIKKFLSNFVPFIMGLAVLPALLLSCSNNAAMNKEAFHSKDGIHFYDSSFQSALAFAKAENKPLFVMIHANWCGICKQVKTEVLPQKGLGDFYNAYFINAAVDFDSEEGKLLRNQFGVEVTPTFLYLTPAGQLINKVSGFQGKEELLATAKGLQVDGKALGN